MSLYVGVMSGTSLDGLDVAVVDFEGGEERPATVDLRAFRSESYDSAFRRDLIELIEGGGPPEMSRLNFEIGHRVGVAVGEALVEAGVTAEQVRAVGSHGQTVWHVPPGPDHPGSTLQIGCPAVIAELTGLDVISDFRTRDMAAGGHGAPLTAYADRLMFTAEDPRLIQNIGGMSNVTALPGRRGIGAPIAFDTGPGVVLIDAAVQALVPGRSYDEGGTLAATGSVDDGALREWLDDPFFAMSPPRSTGREHFSLDRLTGWLSRHADLSVEDIVATLTELTARTIVDGHRFIPFSGSCYLCGGGALNATLCARIGELAAPHDVQDLSALGVDPEAREAIAFALLARQHALGIPANAPWATGAAGRRVLGVRTPA